MTSKQAIITAVTMLSETFRQPVADAGFEGYILALEDIEPSELAKVTKRAVRECKFMPTPAELLALAGKGGPQQLAADTAAAWEAALWARRKHDYTTGVDFGPLVNAVIRNLGGWVNFCEGRTERDLVFLRKKFEELYAALATQDRASLNGMPLAGAFGGMERVAIAGVLPPLQLAAEATAVADVVRELADGKAIPRAYVAPAADSELRPKLEADRKADAAERKREREAHDDKAAEKIAELRARLEVAL